MRLKAGDSDLYYYAKQDDTRRGSGIMAQIMLISRDRTTAEQITEHLEMHQLNVVSETSAEAALAALKQDASLLLLIRDASILPIILSSFTATNESAVLNR